MARPRADSLKLWNFLSITVFREFQGLEKLIFFEHYTVLCGSGHETLLCSSFVSLEAVKCWFFLSITVFCQAQATKHCNAQKNSKISKPETHETL